MFRLFCFLVWSLQISAESKLIVGIDFGTEYLKIAVMRPGKSMEIALNSESQRKTPVAISLKDNERLVGELALSVGTRFPQFAFLHTPLLLGKTLGSPAVRLYQARYPYHRLVTGNNGTLSFTISENLQLSVEQLVAMILEAAVDTALNFATDPDDGASTKTVSKVLITAPPFYGQLERLALLRAAEYAGIANARLVNANAAVALNFGSAHVSRFNATPEYCMFFDMGASSTVVTVASYQLLPSNQPRVRILGVGHDASLGVGSFVDRLMTIPAAAKDAAPLMVARELARQRAEASRQFRVLSANRAAGAMTRDQLRSLSDDLLRRLTQPVEAALTAAGLQVGDLSGGVLLMGGGSRCPLVQEELMHITGRSELGKSVNTDEAAALGAVYLAATTGRIGARRMRNHLHLGQRLPLQLVDANPYPLSVTNNISSTEGRQTLFNAGDPYPQSKPMVFKDVNVTGEFWIALEYGNLSHINDFQRLSLGGSLLYRYSTRVFDQLVRKYTTVSNDANKDSESRVKRSIDAIFRLDANGLVRLEKLEAIFSVDGVAHTLRETVEFSVIQTGVALPSSETRQMSRNLVEDFRRRELAARALARSRNSLEAAVLDARSRLLGTDGDLARCTGPAERRRLLAAVAQAEATLAIPGGDGATGTVELFDAQLASLRRTLAGAVSRAAELLARPGAMGRLNRTLDEARQVVAAAGGSAEQLDVVLRLTEKWQAATQNKLAKADLTSDPPVLVKEIDARGAALEQLLGGREKRGGTQRQQQKQQRGDLVQGKQKRPVAAPSPRSPDEIEFGDDDRDYDDDDDLGNHPAEGEL